MKDLFDELIGEQLSAVTFVQDYFQLGFDGPILNVTNPTVVNYAGREIISWSEGFRDIICSQITKTVLRVETEENIYFKIVFKDEAFISISLKPEEYKTPEAIHAHGFEGNGMAFL